jgi:nucleotide-binding universal stress UspA family protein
MFERILVPLDGSVVGEAALPVIDQLIDKLDPNSSIEITLIGVITLLRHWVVVGEASAPVSYTDEELKAIKDRITNNNEEVAAKIRRSNVIVNTIVATGNAADEILKAADDMKCDLIAMSTHGRSGLRRLAFGSVTDKVLHATHIPVLLVRAPEGTKNEWEYRSARKY